MNRYGSERDRTASQPVGGQGMAPRFLCARCGQRRCGYGRRLQRVQGLRTWVCAGCAQERVQRG